MKKKFKKARVVDTEDMLHIKLEMEYSIPAECLSRHFEKEYSASESDEGKFRLIEEWLRDDGDGDYLEGLIENECFPPNRELSSYQLELELETKK